MEGKKPMYKRFVQLKLTRVFWFNILMATAILIVGSMALLLYSLWLSASLFLIIVVTNLIIYFKVNMATYEMRSNIEQNCKSDEEVEKATQAALIRMCFDKENDEHKQLKVYRIIINVIFLFVLIYELLTKGG